MRIAVYAASVPVGIVVLYYVDRQLLRDIIRLVGLAFVIAMRVLILAKDLWMGFIITVCSVGVVWCVVIAFKNEPRFMILGSLGFAAVVWALETWR